MSRPQLGTVNPCPSGLSAILSGCSCQQRLLVLHILRELFATGRLSIITGQISRLCCLCWPKQLGAPVGRPIIRKGLPSTEHLHHGPWLVRKVLFTEVSAAGLVCPLVMGKRPNFLMEAVGNRPLLSAWPAGHCS